MVKARVLDYNRWHTLWSLIWIYSTGNFLSITGTWRSWRSVYWSFEDGWEDLICPRASALANQQPCSFPGFPICQATLIWAVWLVRHLHVDCDLISHHCPSSMLVFRPSSRRAVISIKTKTTSPIPSGHTIKSNELYPERLIITRSPQTRHHGNRYVEIQIQS